ncbi:MAG: hypothetical protein JWL72_3582 [Ilumatobacteraceae bacterium]|nr:hypothetical protein [Ilumatobacteraceae bacterium]
MPIMPVYARPMPRPREDLLALIHPVARALRRIEDGAADRHGLTMWQYAILSVVAAAPGSNQGEVAKRLQYSVNRIIGDLDLLEARWLLVRRSGRDRRANLLEITTAGVAIRDLIRADIHEHEDVLLAPIPTAQRRELYAALRRIAAAD